MNVTSGAQAITLEQWRREMETRTRNIGDGPIGARRNYVLTDSQADYTPKVTP